MLKKTLVIFVVIVLGFGTGYFSTPIYNFIWPSQDVAKVKLADIRIGDSAKTQTNESQSTQYVSENAAINTVKGLPFIEKDQGTAKMDYAIEQKPSAAYPVWLVEVKKNHPDSIPDIMYIQVDALSGKVLDLSQEDMNISGVALAMTRQEVQKIQGKPRKTKRLVSEELGQVRVDSYDGLEVIYNAKSRVIKVSAQKADFPGPRGLKVGEAKGRVTMLLGRGRTGPASVLTYIPLDNDYIQLVIKLEANNIAELSLQNRETAN